MTRGSNAEKADSVQHPHDRTLRDVLADRAYFAGESRSILPAPFVAELTRRGNLDQLIAAPTEFVDDTLGQRTCDLLYYGYLDGEKIYYLLLEHQSTCDHWMAFRVLEYAVGIWRRHLKDHPTDRYLPLVVPMVLYQGPQPWTAPLDLADLFRLDAPMCAALGALLPRFRYVLDDLTQVDEAALRSRPMPEGAQLLLWLLKTIPGNPDAPTTLAGWSDILRSLGADPARERELATILTYIRNSGRTPKLQLQQFIRTLGPEVEKVYTSTTDEIRAEMRAEMRAEIRAEVQVRTLLRLLTMKFGSVDTVTHERLRHASAAQLDSWTDRIISATTLDELFADEPA